MAKGKIKNPGWIKTTCQFCEKEFDYYRESSIIRKSCYDCIPLGRESDASLIRRLTKVKAVNYKGNRCYCCNNTYSISVYDFHHLNPTEKDFSLGDKTSTVRWDRVKEEIDKCVLVCANCHRMIHSGEIEFEDQQEMADCE